MIYTFGARIKAVLQTLYTPYVQHVRATGVQHMCNFTHTTEHCALSIFAKRCSCKMLCRHRINVEFVMYTKHTHTCTHTKADRQNT